MRPRAERWLAATLAFGFSAFAVGCPQKPPPIQTEGPPEIQAAPVPTTGLLRGRLIRDGTGEPVAGVTVTVAGTDRQVTTDAEGRFQFADLSPGPMILALTGGGIQAFTHELTVSVGEQPLQLTAMTAVAVPAMSISDVLGEGGARILALGKTITIVGQGFGGEMGQVVLGGKMLPLRSWQDGQIVALIDPNVVKVGIQELVVLRPTGEKASRSVELPPSPTAIPSPTSAPVVTTGGGGGGPAPVASPIPTATPASSPTPSASPSPFGGDYGPAPASDSSWSPKVLGTSTPTAGIYASSFNTTPIGQGPAEWVDVLGDLNGKPAWLFPGQWSVQNQATGSLTGYVLHQSQTAPQPWFSMRRYAGSTFGTADGALPAAYSVTAKLQLGESPHYKAPEGEIALLVYYLDPTNYVQLVMEKGHVALFEATNAKPADPAGWKGYMWYPVGSALGETHSVGAEVDTLNGTVAPIIDGQKYVPISMAKVMGAARHYVAVRAAGNKLSVGNVQIQNL